MFLTGNAVFTPHMTFIFVKNMRCVSVFVSDQSFSLPLPLSHQPDSNEPELLQVNHFLEVFATMCFVFF